MRKTAKSNLAKKLESMCSEVYELPETDTSENAAYIIDGMAMLQALNDSLFKSFDDITQLLIKRVLRLLENSDYNIDVAVIVFRSLR